MKNLFSILIFTCVLNINAFCGSYDCYNYEGFLGKYSIQLSYQIMNNLDKNGNRQINAVYKYDKFNNPIRLYGFIDKNTEEITLYETDKLNHQNSKFVLIFDNKNIKGTWTNLSNSETLPIILKYQSALNDIDKEKSFENIKILQLQVFKNYYFIGVYSKIKGEDRVQMKELQIIDKKTNQIFQTLNFKNVDSTLGNVMTIIYNNIDCIDLKYNNFLLWGNSGRMGGYIIITFNQKLNEFTFDTSITIDGK